MANRKHISAPYSNLQVTKICAIAEIAPLTLRRFLKGTSNPNPNTLRAIKGALEQLGYEQPEHVAEALSASQERPTLVLGGGQ